MEKLLLFCLAGVTTLYSQDTKYVKDTVYIIFEASKNQLKEEPYLINRNLEPEIMYKMNFDKENLFLHFIKLNI